MYEDKAVTKGVDHLKKQGNGQMGIFASMWEILKIRWVYHILAWIFGFCVLLSITWVLSPDGNWWDWIKGISSFFWLFIPITYLNFFLKKKLFDKRKYTAYFISIPLQVILGAGLYQLNYLVFVETKQALLQDINNVFFVIALSTGIQYFKRGIVNQYQLQELRSKNALMELNSLKAQINPHFLFNNLNNIYAINQMNSEKGSEMILELADVMRYHLQLSKQEKVSLSDEVQLIKSYIELEKLRLNQNCDLQIEIQESDHPDFIAPLLLLPFIENAFKHGTHPKEKCFVHLALCFKNSRLHFKISNSIIKNKKVVKTNLGINNTVKRLELLYPKKHILDIQQDSNTYTMKLEIDLINTPS
ncbi:MAG: histidine kinase [Bacteroidota bacterium]